MAKFFPDSFSPVRNVLAEKGFLHGIATLP